MFPGIHAQSQSECQRSFHPVNNTQAAECELSFSGRKIPSDVMIVAVYRCVTHGDPQKQLVHTSKLYVVQMYFRSFICFIAHGARQISAILRSAKLVVSLS